ncbi:hypothetical protein VTN02DRAFT_229 [Thermoascus thermophilus]
MASLPKASTVLSWLFYSIPLYIFVLSPLSRILFPSPTAPTTDVLEDGYYGDSHGYALNTTDDRFLHLEDDDALHCPAEDDEGYRVHIFSRAPLVIYVERFLSEWEADHLIS